MDTDTLLAAGLLAVALFALAGIAAIEAGFWRVMRSASRDPFAKAEEAAPDVDWLRHHPIWALAALVTLKTLVFATVVGLFASTVLGRFGNGAARLALGAGFVLALVMLQFVPFGTVLGRGDRVETALARAARWVSYLMVPIARPLAALGQWLVGTLPPPASDEEPRAAGRWAEEAGISEEQREDEGRQMLQGILELEETSVREVMVPRVDIIAVDVETPVEEAVTVVVSHGLSRIPLYEGTLDTVVGMIYAKDLLTALSGSAQPSDLRSLARPAYFIPETKRLADLLREFRASRVHLAIVVDEYGGTAGLVTIEDLLEEIVGEIEDEYDLQHQEQLERVSDHEALVDARMSIDDFNDLFGLDLQAENYDTVGGFVYAQLGRIPNPGDEVRVDGLVVSVVSTAGRRIKRVRVDRSAPAATNGHDTTLPPPEAPAF